MVGLAPLLPDLQKIVVTSMPLEELLVDTYDSEGESVYRSLKYSRVVKALLGNCAENDAREQVNYYNSNGKRQSNSERLNYNLEQVQKEGYPIGTELIVLFNDDNYIYDGQHRASCLYHLYGNIKVPVRRLFFKENKGGRDDDKGTALEKVEIICQNGNMFYGEEQGGVYNLGEDVKSLIIHEAFLGDEIVLDLTRIKRTNKEGEIFLKIQDE